jgi:hypothetical protein
LTIFPHLGESRVQGADSVHRVRPGGFSLGNAGASRYPGSQSRDPGQPDWFDPMAQRRDTSHPVCGGKPDAPVVKREIVGVLHSALLRSE